MRLWIDVVSPSTVPFFKSLLKELNPHRFSITAADHAETPHLLKTLNLDGRVIWRHPAVSGLGRYLDVLIRLSLLNLKAPYFDVGLGFANFYVPLVARSKGKFSIAFTDNDSEWRIDDIAVTFKLANRIVCPSSISAKKLAKLGIDPRKISQFDGYKEDVYVSDYVPDGKFKSIIPIDDYVLVRPEALFAIYVKNKKSIIPELLRGLQRDGLNIVYVPRTSEDMKMIQDAKVYVPKTPVNGLDLCWNARCVMTGSGTFAREAACLNVPAASFYPGELLSVDKALVKEGRIFHSRDVKELVRFASSSNVNRNLDLSNSRAVKKQVVGITKEILSRMG